MYTFSRFSSTLRTQLFFVLFLSTLFFTITSVNASTHEELISRRAKLAARLDSIEVEKQIHKRQGKDLAHLEKSGQQIRDSIETLRAAIAEADKGDLKSSQGTKTNNSLSFSIPAFFKPASLFDWIIIIVGMVALISGVLLIGGIIHSLFSGRSKKKKKKVRLLPKKPEPEQNSLKAPPLVQEKSPPKKTLKDTGGIDAIRQRMQDDHTRIKQFDRAQSPFPIKEETPKPIAQTPEKTPSNKDLIIKAASEGMSIHEISQTYHMSEDQISLILKVAQKRAE